MTQAIERILSEVELLPPRERLEIGHLILQRIPMSDDLNEDDFATLAAASFRMLDEEEDAAS